MFKTRWNYFFRNKMLVQHLQYYDAVLTLTIPEFAQTSQVKNTVPNKTAMTSDTCHKLPSPQATRTSEKLAANARVFTILLGSIVH